LGAKELVGLIKFGSQKVSAGVLGKFDQTQPNKTLFELNLKDGLMNKDLSLAKKVSFKKVRSQTTHERSQEKVKST
jgi:hypothetical protein